MNAYLAAVLVAYNGIVRAQLGMTLSSAGLLRGSAQTLSYAH